jgi:DNA-binding response OmpR family regulator
MQEQGLAVRLGADLFGQISENPEDNYSVVMDNINALSERSKRRKPPVKLIPYGNILLAPKHRQVFIGDTEIELTRTEFDVLLCFMEHRGLALSFKQIYRHVWGDEHDDNINEVVKSAIKRLRRKIAEQNPDIRVITNVRGVGYRMPGKPVRQSSR